VESVDGQTKAFPVSFFTTVGDLLDSVCERVKITNKSHYALFQKVEGISNIKLSNNEYIGDVLFRWEQSFLFQMMDQTEKGTVDLARVVEAMNNVKIVLMKNILSALDETEDLRMAYNEVTIIFATNIGN
jgi:hypothetical protein